MERINQMFRCGLTGLIMLLISPLFLSGPLFAATFKAASETQKAQVCEIYGRLPLYFIENQGQADRRVKFYAHCSGQTTWFTKDGVNVTLSRQLENPSQTKRPGLADRQQSPAIKTTTVTLSPVGLRQGVKIAGMAPQEHRVNYFIGKDPKKWYSDIPTYLAVVYREAYKGIDLKFYGDGRQLEYDIIVKPGADPKQVKFKYGGIKGLEVTPAGDLAIKLPDGGVLVQQKPVIYQEIAGARVTREGKFRLHGNLGSYTYNFEVACYDRAHPLVIDPVLVYSTYLGGGASDQGYAIAVDQAGQIYVTGSTLSTNFPHPNAYQSSRNGSGDAFVTKINSAGTAMVYSTYLGGSGSFDRGNGIAVAAGEAYVVGTTDSTDFPQLEPVQPSYGGGFTDAFVAKLTANGSALIFSTFLGGSGTDSGYAIALDEEGTAYVTGSTDSTNFPTQYPLQSQNGGQTDAFVSKIQAWGLILEYSTYLGGDGADNGYGIAVDQYGCTYVTGGTKSMDFPKRNPLQASLNRGTGAGYTDAFVTKINATGSALVYSTYLGGSLDDRGRAIAVDQAGAVYVTGGTDSFSDFPVQNPLPGGGVATLAATSLESSTAPYAYDAFVTKLRADGQALLYSTRLGGSNNLDEAYGIAVDQQGQAHVAGLTWSSNFPTKNTMQPFGGQQEGFVTKLSKTGSSLVYSTFLSGEYGTTHAHGIAVDHKGNAYVTGHTDVAYFPVKNPLQANNAGSDDAFVMKIYDPPKGAVGSLLLLLLN